LATLLAQAMRISAFLTLDIVERMIDGRPTPRLRRLLWPFPVE
jgi:hypothetical protein